MNIKIGINFISVFFDLFSLYEKNIDNTID